MNRSNRTSSAGRLRAVRLLLVIVLATVGPIAAASDEHGGEQTAEATHGKHSSKGMHELALFLGTADDRGEWADAWGAEYGYSFMDNYVVGAFLERAEGNLRTSVVGVSFWARVVGSLGATFGTGVEFLDEAHGTEGEGEAQGEGDSKRHFFARTGLAYTVHLGKRYFILPVINADFVDEHIVMVGGVSFGIQFGKKAH
jgi:hypothetical protein